MPRSTRRSGACRVAVMAQGTEGTRIVALDLARTGALVAMAIYHFAFDLQMFGYLAPGTVFSGPLRALALTTAASFLCLAGVSLILAQGAALRLRPFLRRLAMIVGAALVISVGSYIWAPQAYIYFGILHAIAALSLVGLALRRLARLGAGRALAGLAFALPDLVALSPRWLVWTGLVTPPRPALDFVPIFPWAAAFLAGMALGRLGQATGFWARLRGPGTPLARGLGWPGRHSLAVYLIHQPVLIGLIWLVTRLT